MRAGPGDEKTAAAAGRGRVRASRADREQAVDALKVAFVQGRLTKDEFDARLGQTFAARRYAELATATADIPAGLPGVAAVAGATPVGAEQRGQVGRVRGRYARHAGRRFRGLLPAR